jgi:hypothetical protein
MIICKMSNFNWDSVWQVGCGTGSRDYREVFFAYGLMAMGARGDEGPFDEKFRPYDVPKRWKDATRKVRTIAVKMELGDTIILKHGKSIVGIGRVIGEYCYDNYFDWRIRFNLELEKVTLENPYVDIPFSETRLDDVDGWDLRHTRKVEWWRDTDVPCDTLSRGACDSVYSSVTIKKAKKFLKTAKK